jgi:hypothetical protein
MARVVGLHEIELRPEADPVEFERVAAEVVSLPMFEGWTTRLLKGERGVRAGKYLLVFEIVDTEARDRYFPRSTRARTRSVALTSRTGRRPMPGNGCML